MLSLGGRTSGGSVLPEFSGQEERLSCREGGKLWVRQCWGWNGLSALRRRLALLEWIEMRRPSAEVQLDPTGPHRELWITICMYPITCKVSFSG